MSFIKRICHSVSYTSGRGREYDRFRGRVLTCIEIIFLMVLVEGNTRKIFLNEYIY